MSYFLCLSIPSHLDHVHDRFAPLELKEISNTPFGKAVCGQKKGSVAYLITLRSTSTDLLDKGNSKNHASQLIVEMVKTLLQANHSVSLLVHFFSGRVASEVVLFSGRERMSQDDFRVRFPDIDDDVRYTIIP
ncbi:MAG: hypothetical protein ACOC6C_03025 [Verrucomicrobiota bacterium]